MKILVTGGAGFIGSHLVEHFHDRADVRVIDNLVSGFKRNLDGLQCEFVECSILDRKRVRQAMAGVDYVFHLAAMVSVPESVQKPEECREINTAGTRLVLEEAAKAGVKKLVFSSSAAIYGNNPVLPKIETMLPAPESPYAATKHEGEIQCELYNREFGLPTVSLRYFNVFGPRQSPFNAYAAAVPIFIERALKNELLTIYGDGMQTRDFIYVKDVVAANAHFALPSTATGTFNIAGGQSITIKELATTILKLTNSRSEILHAPTRPGDVRDSRADVGKSRAAGFMAQAGFAESLQATIDGFRAR